MNLNTQLTEANISLRTLAMIKRAFPPDVVTLGELKQAMADNSLCRNLGKKAIGEMEAAIAEAEANTPAVPETAVTETAFDYSLVDDDTADYLRKATAKIANSYADIGAVLAEAQERLAKHGFGDNNGFFEKWYSSLGMSKKTVYRFIQIHNFRNDMLRSCQIDTNENALEIFDNLPKTLQSDIASPSAPAEAVNAVLSGDITTHKDFVALKKELEEEKNKARLISENYDRLEKVNSAHFDNLSKEREKTKELENKIKSLAEDVENLTMDNERLENENGELTGENTDLEEARDRLLAENKELRNRPVETVIVQGEPTESEEYRDLQMRYDNLEQQFEELEEENERLSGAPAQVPAGLDHEQLRNFFEDMKRRADDAFRDCCHFIRAEYPPETKEYVRDEIRALYKRFETYIDINFGED